MDRNVRHLNLSNPVHAYQLALFLFRVKREEKKLLANFEKVNSEHSLVNDLAAGTWKKWAKDHLDYYPKPKPAGKSKSQKSKQSTTTAGTAGLDTVKEEEQSITEITSHLDSVDLESKGKGSSTSEGSVNLANSLS